MFLLLSINHYWNTEKVLFDHGMGVCPHFLSLEESCDKWVLQKSSFFDKFYSINHWKRCGFLRNFLNGSFFKRKSKLRQPSCLLNPDKRTGAMARNNYIFFERGCFCAIIARLLIHFMSFPFWFFHPFSSHHFFQQKKIMAKNVNNSN